MRRPRLRGVSRRGGGCWTGGRRGSGAIRRGWRRQRRGLADGEGVGLGPALALAALASRPRAMKSTGHVGALVQQLEEGVLADGARRRRPPARWRNRAGGPGGPRACRSIPSRAAAGTPGSRRSALGVGHHRAGRAAEAVAVPDAASASSAGALCSSGARRNAGPSPPRRPGMPRNAPSRARWRRSPPPTTASSGRRPSPRSATLSGRRRSSRAPATFALTAARCRPPQRFARGLAVGQGLLGGESLRDDDHQRLCRVEAVQGARRSAGSTLAAKRTSIGAVSGFSASHTRRGPRSEPPMPRWTMRW